MSSLLPLQPGPAEEGEAAGHKPNVLLADDEPAQRVALTEALAGLEHNLYVAGDGHEALRLLLQRPYAVVLLDVNMPGIDGFEVARLLRARPSSRHTPVIFITAHRADELDTHRGYALGAADYIFAPVSPPTLRAKVSVFLELERMRHALEREIDEGRRARREIDLLNANVRRRAAELEAAHAELDRLTASVSEDLRAPLRAIESYARMVEDDSFERLDPEGRRLLKVVRDESRRMDHLIESLLAFARCGRAPIARQPIDMAELARSVFVELRNGGARTPLLRVSELPPGRADPELIRQAWASLLANAIRHCTRAPQGVVEIDGRIDGAQSVYCVRDNGVGPDGGAGLERAIVERVVSRHGGRVWAESKPGEGTAFYFSLPA